MTIKSQTKSNRIGWIDSAKGIGICLVVFGHVLGGGISRNWFGPDHNCQYIYDFIYMFHMPLFFLLSGSAWICSGHKNIFNSVLNSFRTIAWPYVIWSIVGQILTPITSNFTTSTTYLSTVDFFLCLIQGKFYWFLWALFVIQLCTSPITKFTHGAFFLISILIYFLTSNVNTCGIFKPFFNNLPFFLFGSYLAPFLLRLDYSASWAMSVKFMFGSIVMFGFLITIKYFCSSFPNFTYLVGGVIGSFGIIFLALSLKSILIQSYLQTIGLGSLAIYVSHAYFQGLSREILVRLFWTSPYIFTTLITTISVIGPLIIWHFSRKYGFVFIYRFPNFKKDFKSI